MLRFLRVIRQNLLSDKNYGIYILYAGGEILLVMVGILLALQVDNWNEERKERKQEIVLLENLREDILSDTADIVYNIHLHKIFFKEEKALLNLLISDLEKPERPIEYAKALGIPIATALHQSSFQTIQNNDPRLISNNSLKKKISRHYDYFVNAVILLENELESYNLYSNKLPYFLEHFRIANSDIIVTNRELDARDPMSLELVKDELEIKNLTRLKQDEAFKIILSESVFLREIKLQALEDFYIRIMELVEEIDIELDALQG